MTVTIIAVGYIWYSRAGCTSLSVRNGTLIVVDRDGKEHLIAMSEVNELLVTED
jgi:hypothetical protein